MATIDEEVLTCNRQGISLAGQGRLEEAATCFQRARQLKPDAPASHNNLGNIFFLQGRFAEAVPCYDTALELLPDDPKTLNNLGNTLRRLERYDEAVAYGRRAVQLQPDYAEAHSNLGLALDSIEAHEEALWHCGRAIQLRPDFPEGHTNVGAVLRSLGRYDEAVAAAREALRLRPADADAHRQLGHTFVKMERMDDAAACFRKSLQLRPNLAEAHVSLAFCCWRQSQLDEATTHCQAALRLDPKLAEAHNTQGAVFLQQGRFDEAVAQFDRAIQLEPDLAEAHFNRAMVLLQQGNFAEGWREYAWRWKCKHYVVKAPQRTPWDGSPLAGKSILLVAEQGLGDTLNFIRYAPLVKAQGATVMVACNAGLIPLLSRSPGIDRLFPRDGDLPECDTHAPLLDLPAIFGTTLETIPGKVPYLFADEKLQEHWRRELATLTGFKIGIAWQGNPRHPMDRHRSADLSHFTPLARAGVHLVSLQKGSGSEQLAHIAGRFAVTDFGERLDETGGAFMDTAALMKNLDLIITTDTATAHLAGGLGVPVWVPLPFAADWRWLIDREDSPWYPTMRLFRQTVAGKWDDVFARIAAELARRLAERPQSVSVSIEVAPGELIDKITILEIKKERIADPAKRTNVITELEHLSSVRDRAIRPSPQLSELTAELKKTNVALWEIEDAIRDCERVKDFSSRFVELARSVYHQNDRRSVLKRQINELLGSKLVEEKSYAKY